VDATTANTAENNVLSKP